MTSRLPRRWRRAAAKTTQWVVLQLTAAAILAFAMGSSMAQEAAIYRCGPQARDYSQWPCPDEGRQLQLHDNRTDEQWAAAQRQASADRHLALRLERERLKRETANASKPAGSFSPRSAAAKPSATSGHGSKKRRHRNPIPHGSFQALEPRPSHGQAPPTSETMR